MLIYSTLIHQHMNHSSILLFAKKNSYSKKTGSHHPFTWFFNPNMQNCYYIPQTPKASQVALVVKNPPDNGGDVRDTGLIPELGRFPGGGHGNPIQYSCLENPMDWRAWWVAVHSVGSQTGLEWLSMHSHTHASFGGWHLLVVYHLSG